MRPERREGKLLTDLEEVHGLECMITRPTRVTPVSETLIDVILTNKPGMFKISGSFDPEILSDHHLVYGILSHFVSRHKKKTITFRSLKNADFDELNKDLACAPWNIVEMYDSVDEQYDTWKTIFESVLDKHMPKKKMRVREKDIPYMTEK